MKKSIALRSGFGSMVLMLLPLLASAAAVLPPSPITSVSTAIVPNQNIQSLQDVLNSVCVIFGWLFVFLIAFAIVCAVIAAYYYLVSAGEPEKVKKAGSLLLYAAIAVGVGLFARAIPLIVANFLVTAGTLRSC